MPESVSATPPATRPYWTVSLTTGDEHGFVIRPTGDPLHGRTPPGESTVLRVRLQSRIGYRLARLRVDPQSWKFRIDELRIGQTLVVDRVPADRFSASQELGAWLWLHQWHDADDEILVRVTNTGTEPANFRARLDVARDAGPSWHIRAVPVFSLFQDSAAEDARTPRPADMELLREIEEEVVAGYVGDCPADDAGPSPTERLHETINLLRSMLEVVASDPERHAGLGLLLEQWRASTTRPTAPAPKTE